MAVDSSRLSCLDIWMGHHKVLWEMAENVKISLEDSELENLRVLPKTSPPYPESIIEAARELPLNVTLTLEGSRLKKLNLSANSSLLLNLFNGSRINDFISPELGVYEATVINASIPRVDSKDVTIHVLKRLDFSLELNERPLADGRIVLYYDDEEVMNLTTGEDGNVSAFVYFQRTDNSSTVTWDHYYRVELDYLNFRKSRNILLEETQWYYRIEHNWEDRIGPQITEIGHAPRSWNAMKSVFVRATVTDGEVAVIRNVTVMYSVDGGSWRSVEMMSKGDSRYECSLPGQWFGKEVEYYVVAYDGIGNSNVSPTRSFQVGGEHLRLCLLSIIALFVAIVAIMGLKHWRRRKIMRYAKRRAGR